MIEPQLGLTGVFASGQTDKLRSGERKVDRRKQRLGQRGKLLALLNPKNKHFSLLTSSHLHISTFLLSLPMNLMSFTKLFPLKR